MLIRLETSNGDFVKNADLQVLLPSMAPEVILWGGRCFLQQPMMEVYREVTWLQVYSEGPVDTQAETECPVCLGNGWIDDESCPECNGEQVI